MIPKINKQPSELETIYVIIYIKNYRLQLLQSTATILTLWAGSLKKGESFKLILTVLKNS